MPLMELTATPSVSMTLMLSAMFALNGVMAPARLKSRPVPGAEGERRLARAQIRDHRVDSCGGQARNVERGARGRGRVAAAGERAVGELHECAGVIARGGAAQGLRRDRRNGRDRVGQRLPEVAEAARAAGGAEYRRIERYGEAVRVKSPDVPRGRSGHCPGAQIVGDGRRERDDADLGPVEGGAGGDAAAPRAEGGRVIERGRIPARGRDRDLRLSVTPAGELLAEVRRRRAEKILSPSTVAENGSPAGMKAAPAAEAAPGLLPGAPSAVEQVPAPYVVHLRFESTNV